ncbi:MAG TPA: hypothetical protein VKE24_15255 [Candidatus Acidoferrales bacterium]|nr:hypothetical protein [Candidatus Acidoferrales bacterium]
MPITAFNSFTDGLDSNQRNRGHFIANINVDDDRRWVPYAEGVWIQPCCFNVTSGGFSVVLKALPGAKLGTHYARWHCSWVYDAWSLAVPRA